MASGNKEHRMLFDIRGKRRNVVKVVYAILALLMGLSLFILAGPVGIGGLFGGSEAGTDEAVSRLEDQAARIEAKIAKDPENPELLLSLTRNHVSTANLLSETGPSGEALLTFDSRREYEEASSVWSEYLDATDEPSPGGAQLMSPALFTLAQTSTTLTEAEANILAAAGAQKILAVERPSLGTLSTAALYTLYTFDYAEADKMLAKAKTYTTSPSEREQLDNQYKEVEKLARSFEKEYNEAQKAIKQGGGQNAAKERLQNPLGLGGGTGPAE